MKIRIRVAVLVKMYTHSFNLDTLFTHTYTSAQFYSESPEKQKMNCFGLIQMSSSFPGEPFLGREAFRRKAQRYNFGNMLN